MTMATLPANHITTTCILPPPTIHNPCFLPTESSASIRTTCTTSTSVLRQSAALRDSPTTVHTTAATSDVDDDDRPRSDSSSAPLEEAPMDVNNTFLQEWNEFYREFVNSSNYHRYVTLQHNNATIDANDNDKIAQPQQNQQPLPPTAEKPNTLSQPCPSPKQSFILIQTVPPPVTQLYHNMQSHATVI